MIWMLAWISGLSSSQDQTIREYSEVRDQGRLNIRKSVHLKEATLGREKTLREGVCKWGVSQEMVSSQPP